MAITQVNGTTTAATQSSTTLTIDKPSDVAVGDLLVAGITSDGTAPTAPSGWTLFGGGLHGSASWNIRLYYRFVTGSESADFSWSVGSVGPAAGFINAWRGVDKTNPIEDYEEEQSTTEGEPSTGPGITAVAAIGRMYYVRAVRDFPGDGTAVAADLTEADPGASRRACIGSASSSGNTSYTISHFSSDTSYSTSGAKTGLAVTCDITEDTNYQATYALRAANDGTLTSSLPSVSATLEGERVPNSGPMAGTLPSVTAEAEATHFVPSTGPIDSTLPSVTSSMTGNSDGSAVLAASLTISVEFVAETRQFGEHVILVEADHRAFLVVDDGYSSTGLKPIKRSKVTTGDIASTDVDAALVEVAVTAYDATTTSTGEAIQASAEAVTVAAGVTAATAAIVGSTDADAEAVGVTVASNDATVSTSISGEGSAESVSAAVAANDATVSISISDNGEAELVSSAVTANNATVSTASTESAPAEEVAVAAAVNNASVTAISNITASAELVTASVTANNASVTKVDNITASAELVTATATANNATVTAIPQVSASAGLVTAAVTG